MSTSITPGPRRARIGSPAVRGGAWPAGRAAVPRSRPGRSCPCSRTRTGRLAAVGAGECPLFVAEELGLHEPLGNRGTVDLDEWPLGAGRPGMDGPGDAVFAHPAFAAEQDRRIRVRDVLDDREDGPHPRASVVKWDVAPEIRLWDGAHELFVRERRSRYSFAGRSICTGGPEANNAGNPMNHAVGHAREMP